MADINLNLTSEEAAVLRRLLDTALGDTRVEVHRTHHTPEFRDQVMREENLLRELLTKLPTASS